LAPSEISFDFTHFEFDDYLAGFVRLVVGGTCGGEVSTALIGYSAAEITWRTLRCRRSRRRLRLVTASSATGKDQWGQGEAPRRVAAAWSEAVDECS
jgi:hypothetical protein